MTTTEKALSLNNQIRSMQRALWDASQVRNASAVFRFQRELDRLYAEQDKLRKAGG